MDKVLQHLNGCHIQLVVPETPSPDAYSQGILPSDQAASMFIRLCANRHTVVRKIEASLKTRGHAAVQALIDDVQAALESEQHLYAMLTPAELLSSSVVSGSNSKSAGAGATDVVSDFGLPVSLMRCLLEVAQLQAGLAEILAELLVAIDKKAYPVRLQVNYTKLLLSQFRYLPLADEASNRIESVLFDVIEAASLEAKRDTIALLPELFTLAGDSLCQRFRALLVSASQLDDKFDNSTGASAAPLTPALFDCLTLLPLNEHQLAEFRRVAMQLLASARNCLSIPVLLRFLLDNPPPEADLAVDFLVEIRSRLDMLAVPVEQQQQPLATQQLQQSQKVQPKWLTSTQQPGDTGGSMIYSLNLSCISPAMPSGSAAGSGGSAAQETAETLLCELVQRKLAASTQLADHWLQAIETLSSGPDSNNDDNLHLVDLLVLTAAYSAARRCTAGGGSTRSRRRRLAVLKLTRSLIRSNRLPIRCGADLRCHHPVLARRMAEQLVDLLDGLAAVESSSTAGSVDVGQRWARSMCADLFGCLGAHWQQNLVASLLSRLGTEPDHALRCLVDMAEAWPTELASFAALLRAALDVLHQLNPGQARLLYSALARLAYRSCGGGRQALQDDLCILVRKQLWHSKPMYQSYGVLGALAMLECITPSEQLHQRHLLLSQQVGSQQSQFNQCESDEVKSAIGLVNLVRKACTQAPHVSLLFLDELAALLETGNLHAKVAAWLAEVAKKDFFNSYTASTADRQNADDADSRQPRLGLAESSAQIAIALDSVPTRRLPCLAAHLRLLSACVPARGIAGLALCPLMMPHPALCPPPVLLAAANWCTQVANSFAGSPEFESAVLDRLRRSVELRKDFETAICGSSAASADDGAAAGGGGGGGGPGSRWEQPVPLAQLDGTAVTHVTLRWQNTQQQQQPTNRQKTRRTRQPQKQKKKRRRLTDDLQEDDGDDDDNVDNDDSNDNNGSNCSVGFGYFDADDSVAAAAAAAVTAVVEDLAACGTAAQKQRQSGAAAAPNKLVNADQLGPCYRRLTDAVFQLMNKWTDEQMGEPLILHLLDDLHRRTVDLLDRRRTFGKKQPTMVADANAVGGFLITISQLSPRLAGLLLKAAGFESNEQKKSPAQKSMQQKRQKTNQANGSVDGGDNAEEDEEHSASKSVLDSSCSGRIVQLTMSIFSLAVTRMSADKSPLLLPTLLPLAGQRRDSDEYEADTSTLATVAKQAATCIFQLVPSACPSLETALDALNLCRCILGAPNNDLLMRCGEVLVRRWDVKKRDQLARVYRLLVEAASPMKRPALIGRLLTNHIRPVAAGVSASIESADDPDAVCPSLTRSSLPDAFAQLLGDLAKHCQSNCGLFSQPGNNGSDSLSLGDDADQQLLMRAWPESLAALHAGLEVLRAWPECVRLQALALRHGRALVEAFMRHGLPLLGRQFRCRSEPAVKLLKQIQMSTRQLQAVANTCKDRNDGPTSALVPPLRRTLETFIYRVRALVAKHNCAAAFEPGQLKLKNIQGEEMDEVRRPEEYDVSSTSEDDEVADDEEQEEDRYDDSDAAADDCGDENVE